MWKWLNILKKFLAAIAVLLLFGGIIWILIPRFERFGSSLRGIDQFVHHQLIVLYKAQKQYFDQNGQFDIDFEIEGHLLPPYGPFEYQKIDYSCEVELNEFRCMAKASIGES